jgi:purine-nucleoside phosphorylase
LPGGAARDPDAEITSRQLESSAGFSGRFVYALLSPIVTTDAATPFSQRLDALETAVRARTDLRPTLGIILGSGLGRLADEITDAVSIPFDDLPGWPVPSAPGHAGRLILGRLEDLPVVCLQGRLHMYEGHSERLVVEPGLLMGRLGAEQVLITNASGGVNTRYPAGTLMLIADHINMTGRNPLIGPNDDSVGARFPDMVNAWDRDLRALMRRAVMEAIAARWAGIKLVGVSLVTNPGAGVTGEPLSHEEVLAAADAKGPQFTRLVQRFARLLAEQD